MCTWFKFKEPDMALEFNDNVEKGLTLKVKKFGGYQKSLFNKSQFFTVRHCTFHLKHYSSFFYLQILFFKFLGLFLYFKEYNGIALLIDKTFEKLLKHLIF